MFGFLRRKKPEAIAPDPGLTPAAAVPAQPPLPESAAQAAIDSPTSQPAAPELVREDLAAPETVIPVAPRIAPTIAPAEPRQAGPAVTSTAPTAPTLVAPAPVTAAVEPAAKKPGLWQRFKSGLERTREQFTRGLADLFLGKKQIDDDLLEELETRLLQADCGVPVTTRLMAELTRRVARKELADAEALFDALHALMVEVLAPAERPLALPVPESGAPMPQVILVVGVNGAGKTTTIGKLAARLKAEGRSVMLAAGDTFRAAAVEQLQAWGQRAGVPVIAQGQGADSAAVAFDAVQAAQARGVEVLIVDTAGRLHNKAGLMEELAKVRRVMQRLMPSAPHEVLLVLDGATGQNALTQAVEFTGATGVTGLVLTKLDGTAKGGIVLAISERLGLPIRFVGIGEQIEDLTPFDRHAFVDALLDRDSPSA